MALVQEEARVVQAEGLDVLSLLATRICHDFAGSLGTLAGTLELIEAPGDEAVQLSHELAATLVARVRLLRAAWGGGAGALSGEQIALLAKGVPGGERILLDLVELEDELAEIPARLVLCLLLVAPSCLRRGGSMQIAPAGARGVCLRLSEGAWPAELAGAPDWRAANAPRALPVPMAALTAAAHGWALVLAGPSITAIPA